MPAVLDPLAVARERSLERAAPAVTVDGVSKTFKLPHQKYSTFKEQALHPFKSRRFDELRAVQDVTVTVRQGEFFGIVGRNGSGKSTLLKCLAGIYQVERGRVELTGRLSPFIELGVGFNPDLTARENVIINAIMLGLTRREAHRRFDEIIAFAELEEFLDLKLKNYSSGMSVRLGFSVAIQADADVLLVDEVLAVGDAAFQQKCFEQFHRLKREGKTIIFVTHDMSSVERFCDRAMLMERGTVLAIDSPHAISRAYNELNFGRLTESFDPHADRYGDHAEAEIKAAWFEGETGEHLSSLAHGETLRLAMEVTFHRPVENPAFGFHLRNEVGHTIMALSSEHIYGAAGRFEAGDEVIVRASMPNWLTPGRYTLSPAVSRESEGSDALDLREDLASIMIHGVRFTGGILDPPCSMEVVPR